MNDAHVSGRLELRWLPVTDERGRTHMEACWITVESHVEPRLDAVA